MKKTFAHGSGNRGIPLDYEITTMPAQWVRREKDRIYIGLFNWGNQPVKISVSNQEIPELQAGVFGTDVLTEQKFIVKAGRIEVDLEPHASVCIEIKSSK